VIQTTPVQERLAATGLAGLFGLFAAVGLLTLLLAVNAHRIVPGSADRSYGIHVARLAGVPREVLARAEQVLGELEGVAQPGVVDAGRNGSAPQAV
jgi:hypothetical protein